jgi:hypothetical protein
MNDIILNSNTRDVCGKQNTERAMPYPTVFRATFVNVLILIFVVPRL